MSAQKTVIMTVDSRRDVDTAHLILANNISL